MHCERDRHDDGTLREGGCEAEATDRAECDRRVANMVLPLIPSDVLRGILRLAPHLDAAGLPRYSVRVEGCNARPVIRVEVRRDNAEAEALLANTGVWQIERMAASENRPRHRLWRYRGPAVRLATADGREVCGDCGAEVSR